MDKAAALTRLGLTGSEDFAAVTLAYGTQLAAAQAQLLAAATDVQRQQSQTQLAELVEAYEVVTQSGRHTPSLDSSSTRLRTAAASSAADGGGASIAPAVESMAGATRMETGAVVGGRLEIGALLGQGGMGYVFAARDRLKNEDVAIKVLRDDLLFSAEAKDRFLVEAKVSCSLSHPNIVRVYDVGTNGNQYYLSMERLHGQTLRRRIETCKRENRPFAIAEVTAIARQLIEALRYAHRYIVHRDLKPENVWLAEDGAVKLMDFGIARAFSNSQLTQTGMTLGTAYYMAPEQRTDAKDVDWRADQYALGVMLYEMLAGTLPMGAAMQLEILRPDLPKRYARALMRAMAPRPQDRFASLTELLAELEVPAGSVRWRVAALALGFVAFAAAAGGGIYWAMDRDSAAPVLAESTPSAADRPADDEGIGTSAAEPPANPPAQQTLPLPDEREEEEAEPARTASGVEENPVTADEPQLAARAVGAPDAPRTAPATVADAIQSDPPQRTAVVNPDAARTAQCVTQCERDEAECRGITRRGRQECMRAVAFGASGGRIAPLTTNAAAADCAFYGQARCQHARHPQRCAERIRLRYDACVTLANGSVVERRQDCEENARESEQLCLTELRECRASCE